MNYPVLDTADFIILTTLSIVFVSIIIMVMILLMKMTNTLVMWGADSLGKDHCAIVTYGSCGGDWSRKEIVEWYDLPENRGFIKQFPKFDGAYCKFNYINIFGNVKTLAKITDNGLEFKSSFKRGI